jgi:hypothetical protein
MGRRAWVQSDRQDPRRLSQSADQTRMGNSSGLDHNTLIAWSAGIVAAQAHCETLDEAIEMMQQHANTRLLTLNELASAVLDHRVRFDR